MRNHVLIVFVIIALISCKSIDNETGATYFGGQIINPTNNFITLMKGDISLDTIFLDKKNIFSIQLDSIEEGLYSFKHGDEYQYIYFTPKDSIIIRLNTWDFDESLVFSGKGAEKNNFLTTLYLQNEKNRKSFGPYYNLKPQEFLNKMATVELINQHLYDQLKESGVKLTERFDELAKVTVSYPVYLQKEIYPFIHKSRFQLKVLPSLPKTYYDYRKKINVNNRDLIYYFPYHNYVNNYLYNLAYKKCSEKSSATENILNVIVAEIKVDEFKDQLLYQAIYNDFRGNKNSCCINKTALTIFNEHCADKELLARVNYLAADCESSKVENPIDNFELTTSNNSIASLTSIIKNKKSVIYFWSPKIMSSDMLTKRVGKLSKKYPSLQFIGINMEPLKKNSIIHKSLENQYFLSKNSKGNELVKSKEPRTILVDDKGIVVNSFTYLSSPYFEKQLAALEK